MAHIPKAKQQICKIFINEHPKQNKKVETTSPGSTRNILWKPKDVGKQLAFTEKKEPLENNERILQGIDDGYDESDFITQLRNTFDIP